jgi:hypothetical protein
MRSVGPPHPYTYYRLERGWWWFNPDLPPTCRVYRPTHSQIPVNPLNMPPAAWDVEVHNYLLNRGYQCDPYIYPINPFDVYNTFCQSLNVGAPTGHPTRLVFRELTRSNLDRWLEYHQIPPGAPITIVTVTTTQPLPLAEDYIRNIFRGEGQLSGCPSLAMAYQGVRGHEYVLQPSHLVNLTMRQEVAP